MKLLSAAHAIALAVTVAVAACLVVPPAPASAETATKAGKPMALKKFTKKHARAAKAKPTEHAKASDSKASDSKSDEAKSDDAGVDQAKADSGTAASARLAPNVANASAELKDPGRPAALGMIGAPITAQTASADPTAAPAPAASIADANEVNEIDQAATAPAEAAPQNQLAASEPVKDQPKLTAAMLDSRAEMRDADSPWEHTSTIGKVFVAIGALLTLGSVVRMCIA